ncbi:hypothetical protein J113_01700 [Mycobacterium tuberculosis CAS/NITR204]|uniref:Uncharacterized protein n=1 Tax=Mycobacterium tuberculosis CAS/NITR204 TaxID=1310114 RepID=R4M999_MYCTX|nr:hypothetical protein J113_01700 [Mycobacterium tuberculosis CAS/NITR204]
MTGNVIRVCGQAMIDAYRK